MAQTIRDFVIECELFPHSRENFELIKECSELELMEKYLENQRFMTEYAEDLANSNITFNDGYFQESADSSTITALMEEVEVKKQNIGERIKKLFIKIWNALRTCYHNIMLKLAKQQHWMVGKYDPITVCNTLKFTDEDIKLIHERLDGADEDVISVKTIHPDQPFAKTLTIKYAKGAADNDRTIEKMLAFGISDKTVRLIPNPQAFKDNKYPISMKELDNLVEPGLDHQRFETLLNGAIADVKKNGIYLDITPAFLKGRIDTLEYLLHKYNAQLRDNEAIREKIPESPYFDNTRDKVDNLAKRFTILSGCTSAIIVCLNEYIKYRERVNAALREICDAHRAAGN